MQIKNKTKKFIILRILTVNDSLPILYFTMKISKPLFFIGLVINKVVMDLMVAKTDMPEKSWNGDKIYVQVPVRWSPEICILVFCVKHYRKILRCSAVRMGLLALLLITNK